MKESNDEGRSPKKAQNLRLLHGGSLAFCNIKSIKTTATLLLSGKFIFLKMAILGADPIPYGMSATLILKKIYMQWLKTAFCIK